MKKYCEECGREVDTRILIKRESYIICNETIEVDAQILTCAECGEEFYCEELDNATLVTAYNEYRRKHKLLLPEEIRKIREQYGLSQRSFAKLLNWGDKTICRYENGSIQDKAHNSILLFLREPENMRTYIVENEIAIDARQKTKLLDVVEKLEQGREHHVIPECDIIEDILSEEEYAVLERIYEKFVDFGSVDNSNYSHKERGYSSTKPG